MNGKYIIPFKNDFNMLKKRKIQKIIISSLSICYTLMKQESITLEESSCVYKMCHGKYSGGVRLFKAQSTMSYASTAFLLPSSRQEDKHAFDSYSYVRNKQ